MTGQLDKVLREASTLDGVLEFRHEHFWTLAFGKMVRPDFFIILKSSKHSDPNNDFFLPNSKDYNNWPRKNKIVVF